jgi:hypothetical protein
MRNLLVAIGVILVVLGGVWTGQGAGLIPGSFMTGSMTWLIIGIICLVVGVGLIVAGARRRPPANRRP